MDWSNDAVGQDKTPSHHGNRGCNTLVNGLKETRNHTRHHGPIYYSRLKMVIKSPARAAEQAGYPITFCAPLQTLGLLQVTLKPFYVTVLNYSRSNYQSLTTF